MNIYEALKTIPEHKSSYFKWKHNLYFKQELNGSKTEEEFLKSLGGKRRIDGFKAWERSHEYKNLIALLLQSKVANDLLEVYENVSESAKNGDEKSVKLLLSLNKEIQQYAKLANKEFSKQKVDEEDDGLQL